jgi:hypothetical protein
MMTVDPEAHQFPQLLRGRRNGCEPALLEAPIYIPMAQESQHRQPPKSCWQQVVRQPPCALLQVMLASFAGAVHQSVHYCDVCNSTSWEVNVADQL